MKSILLKLMMLAFMVILANPANAQECCSKSKATTADGKTSIAKMLSTAYNLVDHNGEDVLLGDLIKDKVVVMNFIFTSCKTICPPMGANFAALKDKLGQNMDENLIMLSVSLDPITDTPQRLKAWKQNFVEHEDDKWRLLTGNKNTIDQLLKDLNVFTPLIEEHAPIIVMGSANNEDWIRTNGLASPEVLADKVNQYVDQLESEKMSNRDKGYFTDLELVNQHGENYKFYSDLLKDKIVFINPFFAECPGSCPIMHSMMKEVQTHLGDKLGTSVTMLSITVDPVNDTPEKLKDYAAQYEAKHGWHFLSGSVMNVNAIMRKIGKYVPEREQHDTVILIGNMKTKLWKKANGLANVTEIIEVLDSVINDTGESE